MKKILFLLIIWSPVFLFAQKGIVKPDVITNVTPVNQIDPKSKSSYKTKVATDKIDATSHLEKEIEQLRTQISDLNKKVAVMQRQLEMQLDLILKKK